MKCIILAAGYATRLYPLTENFPKPLLPVQGKPILDHLIEDMEVMKAIDQYIVVTNSKFARIFDDWAMERPENVVVLDDGTVSNETRLGAVKDIQFAIDYLELDEDILVIAGDNLLDFSLTTFMRYALGKRTSCIMRYFEPSMERLQKCGVVTVDKNDRVLTMTEKSPTPASHWCCPPFYYYTCSDMHKIERAIAMGCETDAPGSFVAWLCKQKPVHAMEMKGARYDIGNLESYERVQKEYRGIWN